MQNAFLEYTAIVREKKKNNIKTHWSWISRNFWQIKPLPNALFRPKPRDGYESKASEMRCFHPNKFLLDVAGIFASKKSEPWVWTTYIVLGEFKGIAATVYRVSQGTSCLSGWVDYKLRWARMSHPVDIYMILLALVWWSSRGLGRYSAFGRGLICW